MSNKHMNIVNAACSCKTEDGIWFVHYVLNILFFYDFKYNKITLSRVIPCKNNKGLLPYYAIIYVENRVYLFSNYAEKSFVYNIALDEFQEIIVTRKRKGAFRSVYKFRDYLFVIPFYHENVMKVHLKCNTVEYLDGVSQVLNTNTYINSTCRMNSEHMYAAVPDIKGVILHYDFKREKWSKIQTHESEVTYSCVVCVTDKVIAFDLYNKRLIAMDLQGNVMNEKKNVSENSVILNAIGNTFFSSIDIVSGIIRIWNVDLELVDELYPKIQNSDLTTDYLESLWVGDDKRGYAITKSSEFVIFDCEKGKIINTSPIMYDYDKTMTRQYFSECVYDSVNENSFLGLSEYIDFIQNR